MSLDTALIPTAVAEVLARAFGAKAEADITKAQSEADAAAAASSAAIAATKATALEAARQQVDAVMDAFLVPGAAPPDGT